MNRIAWCHATTVNVDKRTPAATDAPDACVRSTRRSRSYRHELPVCMRLLPELPVGERVLVQDDTMVALVTPAGSGGYVVVAQSVNDLCRAEKMFPKS